MTRRAFLSALLLAPISALARDASVRRAFRRSSPCPATGRTSGACPGYVVDHVIPLCARGIDDPANMQWQDRESAKRKDRAELDQCRLTRRN